jgi:site-specific DNA recombinase
MKAAIYARTSSPNQRYNFSIDAQIDQCLKHCRQRSWDVAYIFIDECQSGKNTDRVRFKQMLEKAKEQRFDVLVFWKLDRLCRSLVDTVNTEKSLRELGVSLCSVTEYIDTTTSVGRFNFRNLASVAEFEREIIGERARMGLYELAKLHRWPNPHPPLGYDLSSNGTLNVNHEEAELVNRCFKRYIETASMPTVVNELNAIGIKPRNSPQWNVPTLHGMLTNRLYIGEYSVAGHSEFIHEYKLVELELFDCVQSIRRRYKQSGSTRKPMERHRKNEKMLHILDKFRNSLRSMPLEVNRQRHLQ